MAQNKKGRINIPLSSTVYASRFIIRTLREESGMTGADVTVTMGWKRDIQSA
jgi:hypothetical protein